MKLYLIIYFIGQVVGVVGPLPYDMRECLSRAVDIQRTVMAKKSKITSASDFSFACESRAMPPAMSPYADKEIK